MDRPGYVVPTNTKAKQAQRKSEVPERFEPADALCGTLEGGVDYLIDLLKECLEFILVDEAGQATEPYTIMPVAAMTREGRSHVVLIGDHQQLPPTVKSALAMTLGYGTSLLERLAKSPGIAPVLLTLQYRMHPSICRWPVSYTHLTLPTICSV